MSALLIVFFSGLSSWPLTAAARADDPAAAKALFSEGIKQYDVGDYQQALDAFKAGFLAKPDPSFLYNMAQCFRRLGKPDDAADRYRAYLRRAPDASNRAEVEEFIREAERQIAARTAAPSGVLSPGERASATRPSDRKKARESQPELVPSSSAPAPPSQDKDTPIYKRPALWIGVGAAVVLVAAGVTVGVVVVDSPRAPTAANGKIEFPAQ